MRFEREKNFEKRQQKDSKSAKKIRKIFKKDSICGRKTASLRALDKINSL
jgi:hypothetical protein